MEGKNRSNWTVSLLVGATGVPRESRRCHVQDKHRDGSAPWALQPCSIAGDCADAGTFIRGRDKTEHVKLALTVFETEIVGSLDSLLGQCACFL